MERKNPATGPSLLGQYTQQLGRQGPWDDLLMRSKLEAEKTGVDFMSLSRDEVYLLKCSIDMMRPTEGNGRWIEIGALTGFTALSMLEILGQGGRIWTLEKDAARAKFLEDLFRDPRLGGRIHVVEGDSRDNKSRVESEGPFEGIFIDGAKSQYLEDLKWAEQNLITGGLVIADNIFLRGEVFKDEGDTFSGKQLGVMKDFLARISDPRLFKTMVLPTSDGLSVSRKLF